MIYRRTWELSTIPDDALYAEVGRRRGSKRKAKSGPKPKLNAVCPDCGAATSQWALKRGRQHVCIGYPDALPKGSRPTTIDLKTTLAYVKNVGDLGLLSHGTEVECKWEGSKIIKL